jgi:hypothetical protein
MEANAQVEEEKREEKETLEGCRGKGLRERKRESKERKATAGSGKKGK